MSGGFIGSSVLAGARLARVCGADEGLVALGRSCLSWGSRAGLRPLPRGGAVAI